MAAGYAHGCIPRPSLRADPPYALLRFWCNLLQAIETLDRATPMNGDIPGFSQEGGARIDSWNITAPYAVLTGHRNALRLSCWGQDYVFPKTSIVALTRHRGVFSVGLRIEHDVPLYPGYIVFWVSLVLRRSPFAHLKGQLEALGYAVEG